ncbi:MAG: hypothetical protein WCK65_04185 [Rhodospirillaceae bacterium]
MLSKDAIRAAIHDLQNFSHNDMTKGQLSIVDNALGLFYEAYAQAVLDEHNLGVNISSICGFIRYVNVIPLNVSMSMRSAPVRVAAIAA